MKNWRDGIAGKEYGRFEGYGDMPPEKNGDYAWLMHILKTLKSMVRLRLFCLMESSSVETQRLPSEKLL